MKLPASLRLLRFGSLAALLAAQPAQASNQMWDGGSTVDGNWSTITNWDGDSAAPGTTSGTTNADIATFIAAIANTWGLTGTPIVIPSNQNIGGISFDATAGNYFIGSTNGNSIKLSSGGTIQILNTLAAANAIETINAPLVIQGANGTYAIANNSANGTGTGAGTLNIGGAISGAAAGITVLTLGGSNTNSNTISGAIGNGSATSLALTKGDAGTWTLTKAPAYTGVTTVSGGSLDIVGPIGNVTMPSSSIINNATMRFALTGGGIGILTLANAISGTGAFTIDTDSSNGSRVQLQGTATSNARTWNIVNKGALWLIGGAGTWGSIMNVNVDLGTGARLSVSGSSATAIFNIGNLTGNGQVIAENATAGETLVVGNGDGSSTYSGVMSGVCALTKAGSGTLTLNGPNTYTGATTVHAGTLALGSAGSLSNSPTIVVGDVGSGGAVLDVTAKTGFTIASNQALKGIGTVNVGPGKVVTNNGTLATGNSIGTLNITGGYKFGATSVWLLETNATTSDQIAISEGVTIASGAQIAFSGGTGAASYVLATYSGLLVGSFASTTPPAGYSLDYSIAGQIRLLLTNGGYTAWAAINAGGQAANLDYDHDGVSNGVEFFMGKTGSSFTANPSVVGGKVTWPRDPAAPATFKVQVSTDLTTWTDVLPPNPSIDESIPTQVTYTLPIGVPKQFCRLAVMP